MFQGFSDESINFLRDLHVNNDRTWFEANRQDYENHLLNPLKELVGELGDFMLSIDGEIEVKPAINKTISRIYRDVRFSKNKTPYRTNLWLTFKRPKKNWQEAPAFYFEINQFGYGFGMGLYAASPSTMARYRELIDTKTKDFKKATKFYTDGSPFELGGESYKRIFDKSKTPEIQQWYQRKSFYLYQSRPIDDILFSENLVQLLMTEFSVLTGLYKFLLRLKLT